jgi:Uma2 family endonuclease
MWKRRPSVCRVVIQQAANVIVPQQVADLGSFHDWMRSEDFPESGRIDFLAGELWIDMSEEQLFSHVRVKGEFCRVLSNVERERRQGFYLVDGARVSHPEAEVSAVPDGIFILNESVRTLKVQIVPGVGGGYVRIEGGPDIVLEVVSDSSVRKDTVRLRDLYWKAGVREYWLVDARQEAPTFEILRHGGKGFVTTRKRDGWLMSVVLGKSFRLTQHADPLGHPAFTLEMR